MRPVMFILESVSGSGSGGDDLTRFKTWLKEFMENAIGDTYEIMGISTISPIQHGYPTEKKRFIAIGARSDHVDKKQLTNAFTTLMAKPVPLTHTYLSFLGLQGLSDEVLDAVGRLPTPVLVEDMHGSVCKCSVDPMVLCAQHPCKCVQCMKGGGLKCTWRTKATRYLADHGLQEAAADGRLTYIQALEEIGHEVPQSPRERNMLNVFARLPEAYRCVPQ